jgi:hypothetical protein
MATQRDLAAQIRLSSHRTGRRGLIGKKRQSAQASATGLGKEISVFIVQKDCLTPVTPIHHVINRPFIFNPQRPRHAPNRGKRPNCVITWDFVSRWRKSAALEGRPIIAQGKAQRRPGFACPEYSQALKGRHNPSVRLGSGMRRFCSALTGLEMFWAGEPQGVGLGWHLAPPWGWEKNTQRGWGTSSFLPIGCAQGSNLKS